MIANTKCLCIGGEVQGALGSRYSERGLAITNPTTLSSSSTTPATPSTTIHLSHPSLPCPHPLLPFLTIMPPSLAPLLLQILHSIFFAPSRFSIFLTNSLLSSSHPNTKCPTSSTSPLLHNTHLSSTQIPHLLSSSNNPAEPVRSRNLNLANCFMHFPRCNIPLQYTSPHQKYLSLLCTIPNCSLLLLLSSTHSQFVGTIAAGQTLPVHYYVRKCHLPEISGNF